MASASPFTFAFRKEDRPEPTVNWEDTIKSDEEVNDILSAFGLGKKAPKNLRIGDSVKVLSMNIKGRNLMDGLPKNVVISGAEVREALAEPLADIVEAVKQTLGETPPELSADILDHGIMLTGGGALLRGLDKLLSQETGMPVNVAEHPLDCVAEGTGRMLDISECEGGQMSELLLNEILDISEGEGSFAVVSSFITSSNQKNWISEIEKLLDSDSRYSGLTLSNIAYGDDDYRISYDQTISLLKADPDIKVICGLSTVAMQGAAQALRDTGSSVKLIGLGLPSASSCGIRSIWGE